MRQPKQRIPSQGLDLKDQVISINRVTKVVKGGKNMSFAALVVVGDEGGHVGFGTGKAREVPLAIKKAVESAKKNLIRVPLINNTLPHQLIGKFGAGRVLVKPASEGTGVIAGGAVRAVMQAVGVHDVRTKVLGSTNPHNVVRATFDALLRMKDPMELARLEREAGRRDLKRIYHISFHDLSLVGEVVWLEKQQAEKQRVESAKAQAAAKDPHPVLPQFYSCAEDP